MKFTCLHFDQWMQCVIVGHMTIIYCYLNVTYDELYIWTFYFLYLMWFRCIVVIWRFTMSVFETSWETKHSHSWTWEFVNIRRKDLMFKVLPQQVFWYDMIWYTIFVCIQKLTNSQLNLPHRTKQKWVMKKLKTKKTEVLGRNGPAMKSMESVLRLEGSLWWERFVKEVGLEPGVNDRGSYGWWEWWVFRVSRCGRSMNRKVRDRGTRMRLTERSRKLISETWWAIPKREISYTYIDIQILLMLFVYKCQFTLLCCLLSRVLM